MTRCPEGHTLNRPSKLWSLKTLEGLISYAQLLPVALGICLLAAGCVFPKMGAGGWAPCFGTEGVRVGAPVTGVLISPSAAGLQCPHFLLHQHCGCLYPLSGRGLPETGLPGDPGVYPGTAPLTAGEPAAGECGNSGPCTAGWEQTQELPPSSCAHYCCAAPPPWVGAQPWGMFPLEGAQHSWLCGNAPGETLKSSTPLLACLLLLSVPLWFCK